jgi:hypothetical protein
MIANELIHRLRGAGFQISASGDYVEISPANELSYDATQLIRQHKGELLTVLRKEQINLVQLVALVGRAYELSDSEIAEAIHIAMDDYSDALTCYTSLAKTLGISLDDDRRMCFECAELSGSYCVAARRGELQGAGKYYRPVKYLPRRCEGYKPK